MNIIINYMQKLLKQALVVGILIIISGTASSFLLGQFFQDNGGLPPVCADSTANAAMGGVFFLSGFLTHLIVSFVGIGDWFKPVVQAVKAVQSGGQPQENFKTSPRKTSPRRGSPRSERQARQPITIQA